MRRSRLVLAIASAVALVVVGVGGWLVLRAAEPEPVRATVEQLVEHPGAFAHERVLLRAVVVDVLHPSVLTLADGRTDAAQLVLIARRPIHLAVDRVAQGAGPGDVVTAEGMLVAASPTLFARYVDATPSGADGFELAFVADEAAVSAG